MVSRRALGQRDEYHRSQGQGNAGQPGGLAASPPAIATITGTPAPTRAASGAMTPIVPRAKAK